MSLLGDIFGFIDAGRAGHAIADPIIAGEHGVLGATANGQQDIGGALATARTSTQNAAGTAVNADARMNQPYINAGTAGLSNLEKFASGPNSKFSFNLNDYFNSPAFKFQLGQGTNAIQNGLAATGRGASGQTLKDLTQFSQGLASTYYDQAFKEAQSGFQTNEAATLANNATLIGAGEQGAARQQTANNIPVQNQQLLASLGLQGNEAIAGLGLKGATTAADLATEAGQARAGSIMGQGNALAGLGGDILGMLNPLVGSIPLPGGGATTLGGIFGGG